MGRKSSAKIRKDSPKRKKEWVEKLTPLFFEKGIKAVSMDDAAQFLGVSKATLYKYFRSREEILKMGMEIKLESISGFVLRLQNTSEEYLARYQQAIQHFTESTSDITNHFLADLKQLHPDLWQLIERFREFSSGILAQYYREGIEQNYFAPLPTSLLVESDRFFFDRFTDPEFLMRENLSLKEAFSAWFQLKFYGLIRPEART